MKEERRMEMEKEGQKYRCDFVAFDDNHILGIELSNPVISTGFPFCHS
jgi:hypothetical protein